MVDAVAPSWYVCMYVCMYEWMNGWMDGWMSEERVATVYGLGSEKAPYLPIR